MPVTEVEQILEGRTEQVHHHHVVVALHGERADGGDAHAAAQYLVELRLVQQLRVLALDRLELDGHLLARGDVRAEVNVSERAGSNLPPEAVLIGHPNLHGCHRVRGALGGPLPLENKTNKTDCAAICTPVE